jgi:serine/threonine-protein kinase
MYPVTMLVASLFVPSVAAQLANPQLLTLFVADLAGIYGCLFLVVLGSDAGWRLRCQLFEAKMIGRYRLLERVGAGGMGEVWRAHDRSLKTDVALKFLKLDRVDDAHIARFEREASATSKLKHPNTVRVSDFGWTDEGYLYYAMEFLDGETLHNRVAREGALASPEANHLFLQIASALGEAHSVGFVHRDVKPANVMVATLGGVPNQTKLLDFGLVKMAENTRTGLTATGWTGGTPSYMAPEVVMGLDADSRSDVYSFGATMYYVLTGQAPFPTASDLATLRAHVEAPLIPPSACAARPISVDLERIVVRCLEKQPERRYRDCAEVAAQLAEIDLSVVVTSPMKPNNEHLAEETRTFDG